MPTGRFPTSRHPQSGEDGAAAVPGESAPTAAARSGPRDGQGDPYPRHRGVTDMHVRLVEDISKDNYILDILDIT
ncbi:hypothetical protein, partial [Streptomyces sp. NPDC002619]|uniref:hypothetical protein n=1 Tax=Streptomyces sp. NPDC002619 TaxID=3364655 RepID=UPI0036C7267B